MVVGGNGSAPEVPVRFLYETAYSHDTNGVFSGGIYAFGVAADGVLLPVSGSPFGALTGSTPFTVAITRDSKYLYSSDSITGALSAFRIQPDGALTSVPGSPFTVPYFAESLVSHPKADFLYASGQGFLMIFAIDPATGALTLTSSVANGGGFDTFTSDGRFLYTVSLDITGFSTNPATGALTAMPAVSITTDTNIFAPSGVAIDPAGRFMYVSNGISFLNFGQGRYAYSIDPTSGNVTPLPGLPLPAGGVQESGAVDASGKFLIVTELPKGGGNCLAVYSINPATGALAAVAGSPFSSLCGVIAPDPSEPYIYTGGFSDGGAFVFALDQTTGALTPIDGESLSGMQVSAIALTH